MKEIIEPVKFMNTDPNSHSKKLERLSTEKLEELTDFYVRIMCDNNE